jgi:glutamate-1-semialdehyde 2,1-aminomutase
LRSLWSRSKALHESSHHVISGGVTSSVRASMLPHPLYFESGKGARLVDVEGNSYIDYALALGPLILGHAHPALVEAVQTQVEKGTIFGSGNRLEIEAARKLLGALGWAERVLWTNTGTEAVQVALRMARAATGRDVVIKLTMAYHGWHDSVTAGPAQDGGRPTPGTLGQPAASIENLRISGFDSDSCAAIFAAEPGKVAAVIIDPMLADRELLLALRRLCDENGALLILDEVVSGLRLGLAGGAGYYDVVPDLATYGKALGGGIPVAAVAGRAQVLDVVNRGAMHAGTFNGNVLSMAAVLTVLDVLSEPGVYDRLDETGDALAEGMRGVFAHAGHDIVVHHVTGCISVVPGVPESVGIAGFAAADWRYWSELVLPGLLERGVYATGWGRFLLSTAHSADEVAETVEAFADILSQIRAPEMRVSTI